MLRNILNVTSLVVGGFGVIEGIEYDSLLDFSVGILIVALALYSLVYRKQK